MSLLLKKKDVDNSLLLTKLFNLFQRAQYWLLDDRKYIDTTFKKNFKRSLNWEHPETFQEKLQWTKLYFRNDLITKCADKIKVRDFVAEKIGEQYLIPQYLIFHDAKELQPEKLPEKPFIIKCNHNSAAYTIVRDKNLIDWEQQRKKFKNLLSQNYYYQSREWQYKNIAPRIIIEKLLLDENNNIPLDYKFYCYNGIPKNIHVSIKRNGIHYVVFFDLNWNIIPLKYADYSNKLPFPLQKPKYLNTMIALAKTLSQSFPFARVDFYHNKEKIYFGEITFHPGSGLLKYEPEDYNSKMGNWINLNPFNNPE